MNYDNSNSGAVFASKEAGILNGMFQFSDEQIHAVSVVLGEPGTPHQIVMHKRGKDGAPVGKPIATGELKRCTALGPFTSTNGNVSTLVARGFVKHGKTTTKLVAFKVVRTDNTAFYQLKEDLSETRPLADL